MIPCPKCGKPMSLFIDLRRRYAAENVSVVNSETYGPDVMYEGWGEQIDDEPDYLACDGDDGCGLEVHFRDNGGTTEEMRSLLAAQVCDLCGKTNDVAHRGWTDSEEPIRTCAEHGTPLDDEGGST